MPLIDVKLENFRSYEKAHYRLGHQTVLIVGLNGSGKTNMLEAIYLLASARSFRGTDKDMVRHGSSWYSVTGKNENQTFQVAFVGGNKTLKLNHKSARPERFVGRLPAILFEPSNINIVSGAPEERRRFLNRLLAAVDAKYLRALINYKRVLRQRNALLRQKPTDIKDQIFGWDIKLVEQAGYIFNSRQQLLKTFNQKISQAYRQISESSRTISLKLMPVAGQDYSHSLLAALQASLSRDLVLGHTTVGPHRDDVVISFDGQPVATEASRGEQRTLTLALKLLELDYLEGIVKQKPLILLDDVFSELDIKRRGYLLSHLQDYQTIITATDLKGISGNLPKGHVKIELGTANARRRQNLSQKSRQAARSRTRRSTGSNSKTVGKKLSSKSASPEPKRRRTKAN